VNKIQKSGVFGRTIIGVIAWFLSLLVIIPFLLVIINSLKTSQEASTFNMLLPETFQWGNYWKVIEQAKMFRSFVNSFILAFFPTVICIIVSAMAAFVISRNKDKWNNIFYKFFFLGLIAPVNYVTTVGVLNALKLLNTYMGAILLMTATGIPFAIFLFYGFISSVPKEMDEAGIIDGCGLNRLFLNIILPILKPVTITVFVLNFLGAWNDFMTPLYILNQSSQWGMVLAIYNFYGQYSMDWNLVCAAIILTISPILIIYVLGQKYIISGMTAGAVKG
jgi:raffinose/stachyose/melibiose transport system permease protein